MQTICPQHRITYGLNGSPQTVTCDSTDSARCWFDTWADVRFLELEWASYAWPGGYEIHYVVKDGGTLCHHCANNELMRTIDPDDEQFFIVGQDIHWEGEPLHCDHCNREILPAYGGEDAD